MWRNATLAMVVSSTSMKVAIETTKAIEIGIVPAGGGASGDQPAAAVDCVGHRTRVQGTTDMPGPIATSAGQLSTTIFTGTRCTTFT